MFIITGLYLPYLPDKVPKEPRSAELVLESTAWNVWHLSLVSYRSTELTKKRYPIDKEMAVVLAI